MNLTAEIVQGELYETNAARKEMLSRIRTALVEAKTALEQIEQECQNPNLTKGMNLEQTRGQLRGCARAALNALEVS